MNTPKQNVFLAGKILILGGIFGYIIAYSVTGQFSMFRGDFGIPIFVAVFGLIGTLFGLVSGTITSIIVRLIVEHDLKWGIMIGGIVGFAFVMYSWYNVCWLHGSVLCISQ